MIITENQLRTLIRQQLSEGFFDNAKYKAKQLVGALPDHFSSLKIQEIIEFQWLVNIIGSQARRAISANYNPNSKDFAQLQQEHEHYLIKWIELLIKYATPRPKGMVTAGFNKSTNDFCVLTFNDLKNDIKSSSTLNVYKNSSGTDLPNFGFKFISENDHHSVLVKQYKCSILYWLIEFYKTYFSLSTHERDLIERTFYMQYSGGSVDPKDKSQYPDAVSNSVIYTKTFGYPKAGILNFDSLLPPITSDTELASRKAIAKKKRDAQLKADAMAEEKRQQQRDLARAAAEEKRQASTYYPPVSSKNPKDMVINNDQGRYDPNSDRYYGTNWEPDSGTQGRYAGDEDYKKTRTEYDPLHYKI